MITGSVVIAGKEYPLGELAFSDENVALFESLMNEDMKSIPIAGFRRALHEALVSGGGLEQADEAMASLKINFKKGSDLIKALEALGKSLGGA